MISKAKKLYQLAKRRLLDDSEDAEVKPLSVNTTFEFADCYPERLFSDQEQDSTLAGATRDLAKHFEVATLFWERPEQSEVRVVFTQPIDLDNLTFQAIKAKWGVSLRIHKTQLDVSTMGSPYTQYLEINHLVIEASCPLFFCSSSFDMLLMHQNETHRFLGPSFITTELPD